LVHLAAMLQKASECSMAVCGCARQCRRIEQTQFTFNGQRDLKTLPERIGLTPFCWLDGGQDWIKPGSDGTEQGFKFAACWQQKTLAECVLAWRIHHAWFIWQ
jgi:hypothetical protein